MKEELVWKLGALAENHLEMEGYKIENFRGFLTWKLSSR